jgi:hypothetical protein
MPAHKKSKSSSLAAAKKMIKAEVKKELVANLAGIKAEIGDSVFRKIQGAIKCNG